MGLFDFNNSGPKVSKQEFEKARVSMASKGLTEKERDEVQRTFEGHLDEGGIQKGISKDEVEKGIESLHKHRKTHSLSDNDIAIAEGELKKRL